MYAVRQHKEYISRILRFAKKDDAQRLAFLNNNSNALTRIKLSNCTQRSIKNTSLTNANELIQRTEKKSLFQLGVKVPFEDKIITTQNCKNKQLNKALIQRIVRIGKKKIKGTGYLRQLLKALNWPINKKSVLFQELEALALGKNITVFKTWDEAFKYLSEPKILVKCNDVISIIKNTTDLLIWLGSYPSSHFPLISYATSDILNNALVSLEKQMQSYLYIGKQRVWNAVYIASQTSYDSSRDKEWGELELVEREDLAGKKDEIPGRYRRKIPAEMYLSMIESLKKSLSGYNLVGVHATTMERMASLVKNGVDVSQINTENGSGKGKGFYIIPGTNLDRITKEAKVWGSHVVAVYLPEEAIVKVAQDGENVDTLELGNETKGKFYYSFGKLEAVISPSLCADVRIVVDPSDISMGNTEYEAEMYNNEFGFLNTEASL